MKDRLKRWLRRLMKDGQSWLGWFLLCRDTRTVSLSSLKSIIKSLIVFLINFKSSSGKLQRHQKLLRRPLLLTVTKWMLLLQIYTKNWTPKKFARKSQLTKCLSLNFQNSWNTYILSHFKKLRNKRQFW
jgi:hypothetical protein